MIMTRGEQIDAQAKALVEEFAKEQGIDPKEVQDLEMWFKLGCFWADKNPNGSRIKWQTGEPKYHGRYLVQTKEDGFQIAFWSAYVQSWSLYHNSEILAWCKLIDIEPYKEETK